MTDELLPELFLEASELDGPERRAFLERVDREHPALAGELRRLLTTPTTEASPIDRPIAPVGSAAATEGGERAPVPARVGPYRIERELGQGGMGRVFLAEQETPDFRRTVALKLIDRPGSEAAVRRFRDEVRILASLEHPGIVRFLDGGRSPEGVWYLALEYVRGPDLLTYAAEKELDVRARVALVRAVADAVEYANCKGVVHRDIKPGNVLVRGDGQPRLLDFGISKLLDRPGDTRFPTGRSGIRPLTPAYASPEQLAGDEATAASDVYSLGVVLYELLTGARPAGRDTGESPTAPSALARRGTGSGSPGERGDREGRASTGGRSTRGRISRDLDAVCLRALAPRPEDRYPRAGELAADLDRYLEGVPVAARRRRNAPWRALVSRPRGRVARATLVAALGAVAILGAFALRSVVRWRAASPRPGATAPDPTPRPLPFNPLEPGDAAAAEARWAESPSDLARGAQSVLALAEADRFDEAGFALKRLRQIPGAADDPLADYVEALVAVERGESQKALVLLERALANASAAGRGELLGAIRLATGTTLLRLGQRAAARDELAAASDFLERAGDDRLLERAENALALVHSREGAFDAARDAFERAIAAGERAGTSTFVTLGNFAELERERGRPDLAEAKLSRMLELRKSSPNALREGQTLQKLALALRDLGQGEASAAALDGAVEKLRSLASPPPGVRVSLAAILVDQARSDLERARFDRFDSRLAEIDALARELAHRRTLGYGNELAARRAALAGALDEARRGFAEARTQFLANGDVDLAAAADRAWAEAEALAGDPERALRVLDDGAADAAGSGREPGAREALLRARFEARAGRAATAMLSIDRWADDAEALPSLAYRLPAWRARAAYAEAVGGTEAARRHLDGALAALDGAGRDVLRLEIEIERAALDPDPAAALAPLVREAERRHLTALAAAARRAIP